MYRFGRIPFEYVQYDGSNKSTVEDFVNHIPYGGCKDANSLPRTVEEMKCPAKLAIEIDNTEFVEIMVKFLIIDKKIILQVGDYLVRYTEGKHYEVWDQSKWNSLIPNEPCETYSEGAKEECILRDKTDTEVVMEKLKELQEEIKKVIPVNPVTPPYPQPGPFPQDPWKPVWQEPYYGVPPSVCKHQVDVAHPTICNAGGAEINGKHK